MKLKEIYDQTVNVFEKLDEKYQHKIPYIYAIIGSFTMALASLVTKKLNHIPVFELLYFRSIFVLIFNLNVMKVTGESTYCTDKNTFKFLILRALFSNGSSILFFTATQLINLGESTILFQTSPIWSNFVACMFFGEGFCMKTFGYTLISFIAIIFLLKPPFLFNESQEERSYEFVQLLGQLLSLLGAISFAVMSNINKLLKGKASKQQMILYIHIGALVVSSLLKTGFGYSNIEIFSLFNLEMVLLFGLCAYLSQIFINQALFMKGANKIMPFNYSQVIFAIIFDLLLFNKTIDVIQMMAGIVVMYCCYKIATKH
ncbi:hypothetical protein ABPG72_008654 [Tetrahymena utriculariae]